MSAMGASIRSEAGRIEIEQSEMTATDVIVPGDISSAAPWLVAGLVHPDARITVRAVGINPTRTGILDVLREMDANMTISNEQEVGGEPIADITVESSDLRPVEIGGAIIPRLIDELPVLTVAALHANGVSRFRDATELRIKETDRITTTSGELSRMGARVEEIPDGMVIYGGQRLAGAVVRSHGDHRLAMTLAVAAMAARGETTIQGADAVHVSYPAFWGTVRDCRNVIWRLPTLVVNGEEVLGPEVLHIGFGNHVIMNRVIAIVSPGSAPTRRLIQESRSRNAVIDMTNGRRTKAVLITDSGHVVLAPINPETVAGRVSAQRGGRIDGEFED